MADRAPTPAEKFAEQALPTRLAAWGVCLGIAAVAAGGGVALAIRMVQAVL
jgi:hypothetical protein